LLPWKNADGTYSLREITLSTLKSTEEVRGLAAKVYVNPRFTSTGFEGKVARPRLTKSGDVYIPRDIESSLALVVYAQLEQLYFFEQSLGTLSQLRWPRQAGVEVKLDGPSTAAFNNAHYFPIPDVMGIVPFSLGKGVPMAVNQGIVAHEHFHAHFQSQVLKTMEVMPTLATSGMVVEKVRSRESSRSIRSLNEVVLRGWNEGLADFFGATYMGQADFFSASLPAQRELRALDEAPIRFMEGQALQDKAAEAPQADTDELLGLAYWQGTALARLLYRISQAPDTKFSQRELLALIMKRLQLLPAMINRDLNVKVMDFDQIVPVLLQGLTLSPTQCADIGSVMNRKLETIDACPK